jgi:leucyl-tRNA synthetase
VESRDGKHFKKGSGHELVPEIGKMSKSRFNVVPPDELIDRYGADTERVYTLFIAPPEKEAAWSDDGVVGGYRFLNRVWNLGEQIQQLKGIETDETATKMIRKCHQTIAGVSSRMEKFEFNTAISLLMELSNAIGDYLNGGGTSRIESERAYLALLGLLHPFAPHVTEELWEKFGHAEMLITSPWPIANPDLMREDVVTVVVQVNGKLRGQVEVAANAVQDDVIAAALANEKVAAHTAGKTIVKTIYVAGKLVNVVVK